MQLFIAIILAAAAFQSMARMALLPRKWTLLLAMLVAAVPPLSQRHLTELSMADMKTAFESVEYLQNRCVLVVIQELLAILSGFSLLEDHMDGTRSAPWKYVAFLPSALLPSAVQYLQMQCFNHFLDTPFRTITWTLSAVLCVTVLLVGELLRHAIQHDTLILKLFSMEWILLLLAMFVPLAATAGFVAAPITNDVRLLPLLWLCLPVLFSMAAFIGYRKIKDKYHVKYHANP